MMSGVPWERTVFVAMPFGTKPVGGAQVDFDATYDDILKPGIDAARLPNGDAVVAYRADRGGFSADIDYVMYKSLEEARLVLVDITGANANVFYELGVRHRARNAGTVVLRQQNALIPFDISHVTVFPYDPAKRDEARAVVTGVVEKSLAVGAPDSPVRRILASDKPEDERTTQLLHDATEATRKGTIAEALGLYEEALRAVDDPEIHVRAAILANRLDRFDAAVSHTDAAVAARPAYAEAYRERGIALGKLGRFADGEAALRRSIELNGNDYDAIASLGGVLRKSGKLDEALAAYDRASTLTKSDPYPLLNALKLKLLCGKQTAIGPADKLRLKFADGLRRPQATATEPQEVPWSFFDLSDIAYFSGDAAGYRSWLEQGLVLATPAQVASHLSMTRGLADVTKDPLLIEGVQLMEGFV